MRRRRRSTYEQGRVRFISLRLSGSSLTLFSIDNLSFDRLVSPNRHRLRRTPTRSEIGREASDGGGRSSAGVGEGAPSEAAHSCSNSPQAHGWTPSAGEGGAREGLIRFVFLFPFLPLPADLFSADEVQAPHHSTQHPQSKGVAESHQHPHISTPHDPHHHRTVKQNAARSFYFLFFSFILSPSIVLTDPSSQALGTLSSTMLSARRSTTRQLTIVRSFSPLPSLHG
jgi:hypothetical protein